MYEYRASRVRRARNSHGVVSFSHKWPPSYSGLANAYPEPPHVELAIYLFVLKICTKARQSRQKLRLIRLSYDGENLNIKRILKLKQGNIQGRGILTISLRPITPKPVARKNAFRCYLSR